MGFHGASRRGYYRASRNTLGGDGAKGILRMVALDRRGYCAPSLLALYTGLTDYDGGWRYNLNDPGIFALLVQRWLLPWQLMPSSLRLSLSSPSQSAAGDSYFINSQSNRARINETIPVVYGMHKLYANLAICPLHLQRWHQLYVSRLFTIGVLGNLDVWDSGG